MSAQQWMQYAEKELGQKEIPGLDHNPRIVEYQQATSLGASDDETAWCASFANWVLLQADIAGTNSPAARSFLAWGRKIKTPKYGCIVVFKRGNSDWQGHVGFYMGEDETHISVLGGNQSNSVSVARYRKSDLLGYRMPKRVIDSKTIIATTVGAATTISTTATEISIHASTVERVVPGDIQWSKWVTLGVIVVVAGIVIFERVKKILERQI